MKLHLHVLQKHHQWDAVCAIYRILKTNGHQALLAGGCVRDALLGRVPQDLDIATDAPPEKVEQLFPRTVGVGKSFGVIRVLIEGADIEVATFRRDGTYSDGRRPDEVVFASAEEDAQRRDFTINALFMDPGVEVVLDFVEGQKDLQAGIIRTVGDAHQRFSEDHLRILRAVRFSGQLGFAIESQTLAAIQRMADKVLTVSAERINEEMSKLLKTSWRPLAFENLQTSGLMKVLFPFRQGESSFLNIPTGLAWQLWILFFLPLVSQAQGLEAVDDYLQKLKFSKKDSKRIQTALVVLQKPASWFANRRGELLLQYGREEIRFACQVMTMLSSSFQSIIEELHRCWLAWGEALPEAFLTGHDVPQIQGKALGEKLKEAYWLQLEGVLANRESALQWVAKNS